MKKIVLVEFDNRCIKTIIGILGGKSPRILDVLVKAVESDSPLDLEKAFRASISKFIDKKRSQFLFYIPRSSATLRNLSFPSVEDKELNNIVQLHLTRQVPYAREDIIYDFKMVQKTETGFTEILLGIVHRAMLRKYFVMFEKSNIYGDEIRLSSFGLLSCANRLSERLGETGKTNIFIDIDSNYTDFIVYRNKKIVFSKSITVGAKDLKSPESLTKFIGDLRQSFTMFNASQGSIRPERIYISGALQSPDSVKVLLEKELSIPVDIVRLEDFVGVIEGVEKLKEPAGTVSFTALLGAFINPNHKGLVFTTSEARMKKNIKVVFRDAIYAGSIIVYLIVLLSFFSTGTSWLRENFSKKLDKEVLTLKQEYSGLIERAKKIKLVDINQNYSNSFLYYYYNVAKLLPKEITLERVIFEKDDEFTLIGRASDMAEIFKFISVLNDSGYFKRVDLRYSRKRREEGKETSEFEINNFLHTRYEDKTKKK